MDPPVFVFLVLLFSHLIFSKYFPDDSVILDAIFIQPKYDCISTVGGQFVAIFGIRDAIGVPFHDGFVVGVLL